MAVAVAVADQDGAHLDGGFTAGPGTKQPLDDGDGYLSRVGNAKINVNQLCTQPECIFL